MKSKTIFILFIVMLLGNGRLLYAQSAKVDFEEVFKRYTETEHLSMTMEVYSFSHKNPTKANLSFKGTFKKSGENFYTKAWDREMIVKGNKMVVVNHEDQKIAIGKARELDTKQLAMPVFSIDSLEAHGGSVEFVGREQDQRQYRVTLEKALVHQTDIFLNDSDIISRIVYHYQELEELRPAHSKLEILYQNVNFDATSISFFDEKKFLVKNKNGDLQASARYAAYSVNEIDYNSYSNSQF